MNLIKSYVLTFFLCVVGVLIFQRSLAQGDSTTFKRTALVKLIARTEGLADQSAELLMQMIKVHDVRKVSFVVQSGKGGSFLVDTSHVTVISLSDSARVELKPSGTIRSSFGGMGFGSFVTLDFELSDEQYEMMKSGTVIKVDIPYSEGDFIFDINDAVAAIFKETVMMID